MINELRKQQFQSQVWDYYSRSGRHSLPWRQAEEDGSFDPYKIIVSEIMLQQTQVSRVVPKYNDFIGRFPSIRDLALAPQGDVLRAWSGLGYNRRAKYLHQTAQQVMNQHRGKIPLTVEGLTALPGIGHNTAAAIRVYSTNDPAVFIETNIRATFIHHFFKHQSAVSDRVILDLVDQTIDRNKPRQWYWALMDYGSYLKAVVGNPNRLSKHYAKQSRFDGSKRQLRGQIIRLLAGHSYSEESLQAYTQDERLTAVLAELLQENLIRCFGGNYYL